MLSVVGENEMDKFVLIKVRFFLTEPPLSVVLEVVETEPGIKGDTATTGATKPCVVETGATVLVPLFVGIGDKLSDTKNWRCCPEHRLF